MWKGSIMYIDNGKLFIDAEDACHTCRKNMKKRFTCALLAGLNAGVVYIDYDGADQIIIGNDCCGYEEKNLRLVKGNGI